VERWRRNRGLENEDCLKRMNRMAWYDKCELEVGRRQISAPATFFGEFEIEGVATHILPSKLSRG
jgi:hypothetical protein